MAYYNDYRTFGNRVIATEDNGQSATYNDLADFSANRCRNGRWYFPSVKITSVPCLAT